MVYLGVVLISFLLFSETWQFFQDSWVFSNKSWILKLDSFSSNVFFRVIFFLLETGFGSIVMVYLQTYTLCILTLLCGSTVLWLSPFGNFGYISSCSYFWLIIWVSKLLAFSSADEELFSEMAIQDIKIGIDWFFFLHAKVIVV